MGTMGGRNQDRVSHSLGAYLSRAGVAKREQKEAGVLRSVYS